MPRFNSYEFAARTLKVDAIVRTIYKTMRPSNAFEAGALKALLTAAPQKDRDALARVAGARSPSETTWRQVVDSL